MSSAVDDPSHPDADLRSVGARLRELRLARRLTLKVVAERAEISESFLSQIELGRNAPSLRTIRRISTALAVDPSELLSSGSSSLPKLVRRGDASSSSVGTLARERITPRGLTNLEVLRGKLSPEHPAPNDDHTHGDSEEIIIVMSGSVHAVIDGRSFNLTAGDTLCYRSTMAHSFSSDADSVAEVMWIVTPPSY